MQGVSEVLGKEIYDLVYIIHCVSLDFPKLHIIYHVINVTEVKCSDLKFYTFV